MAHRYKRTPNHQAFFSAPNSARTSTSTDEMLSLDRVNSYFLKEYYFYYINSRNHIQIFLQVNLQ